MGTNVLKLTRGIRSNKYFKLEKKYILRLKASFFTIKNFKIEKSFVTIFFFVNIVLFKVSLSTLTKLLVPILFYAHNILRKRKYVVTVLQSKESPNLLT